MKSYPSTLNKGGKTLRNNQITSKMMSSYMQGKYGQSSENLTQGINFNADRIKSNQLDDLTKVKIGGEVSLTNVSSTNSFENPFEFSEEIFHQVNKYRYVLKRAVMIDNGIINDSSNDEQVQSLENSRAKNKNVKAKKMKTSPVRDQVQIGAARSLFSQMNAVQIIGMTENVPLIDDANVNQGETEDNVTIQSTKATEMNVDEANRNKSREIKIESNKFAVTDTSDCTIGTLVALSKEKWDSPKSLGAQIYTYQDFMYCKELGQISNNHLITLRRFPAPIGDNITRDSKLRLKDNQKINKKTDKHSGDATTYDIGRLVTWFGTEDNKLEDIMKYSYSASWKEFKSEIQELPSREEQGGFLASLINSANPSYNSKMASGLTGTTNLFGYLGQHYRTFEFLNKPGNQNQEFNHYNWDKNKIYEPRDTIQSTHKYEGVLKMDQEITLTFNYKLRAFNQINPKSAFLDLLGNIMVVTYKKGRFWGGSRRIAGAPQNSSGWKVAQGLLNKQFDNVGGVWDSLLYGGNIKEALKSLVSGIGDLMEGMAGILIGKEAVQAIENTTNNIVNGMQNAVKGNTSGAKSSAQNAKQNAVQAVQHTDRAFKKRGVYKALKGAIQNSIGRPQMYAFNSLLTGAPVGLWHLTIGNPRNPIATIGNLMLMNAEVTHSGPLGIDDFPTDLKVVVKLKHGRSRDSTEIERMYTQGRSAIYASLGTNPDITEYYGDKLNGISRGDYVAKLNEMQQTLYKRTEDELKEDGYTEQVWDELKSTDHIGAVSAISYMKKPKSHNGSDVAFGEFNEFDDAYIILNDPIQATTMAASVTPASELTNTISEIEVESNA